VLSFSYRTNANQSTKNCSGFTAHGEKACS
jgi:hypothetical protein